MDKEKNLAKSAPSFPMPKESVKSDKYTDPKEKRLANWIEDVVTMQRVNLVLLIVTLMMLILHLVYLFYTFFSVSKSYYLDFLISLV